MAEKTAPRLGLRYGWLYGEDGWDTGYNLSMKLLDVLTQLSVLSATTAATPGSPDNGDTYLIPASGISGDWVGNEGKLVTRIEDAWAYHPPAEGWVAWVEDVQRHMIHKSGSWQGLQPYDIGLTFTGKPAASVVMMRYPFPRAVTFPAGMTGSKGVAAVAATAQTDFDVKKNGSSVGTIRFAAAGTVATFIMASATSFDVGDILTVVAPGTADTTLADMGLAITGVR
jgi:hypothetical protein